MDPRAGFSFGGGILSGVGAWPPRCAFLERGRAGLGGPGQGGGGAGGARGTDTSALSTGRLRDPVLWLVALPSHGSALLALVALVDVASDPAASHREHSE